MAMIIAAFGSGLVFGLGLVISGMTQPSKVLGFLDVFGNWDPTLAIVMACALLVTAPGFILLRRRDTSILGVALDWPTRRTIDRSLIGGAALFGIGWGLVGLCPGPALANLAGLSPKIFGFVVTMAIGAWAQNCCAGSADRSHSQPRATNLEAFDLDLIAQKTICDRAAIQSIVAPR